ncbi:MAG TPA: tetratricopeptide repeat protein, partial [Moheibacter sp.]|nr:tetratricopeptide repeat protein [Moheibacter sp.]
MKHRSLLIFISIFNFGFLNAQYHLEQLSDSLKVYLEQGWHCWNETDETSCIPYYQKFFKAVKESGECLPCAETELARIYAWEGQYEKSIAHAQNVLKDAEKYNGRLRYELELDANNEIGGNYLELGNLEKALEYFFASLEASNEITKFAPATSKQYGAITRFNIGGVYSSMNDCKRAIKFEKEAFHELTEMGNNRTCQIADAIAGEYLNCNQSDSAKIWAFKAIQLAKSQKIGNQYEMSAYSRLAEIYKDSNPDSALYYINKALKFESAENLFMQTARIYTGKGNILSAQGKYTEARESFTKAEELLPTNAIQDLAILYHAWGKAAHKNQDHKTASEKLLQFTELNDSINSERTQKTVRELNAKYETEKKEKQIAEQELKIQTQKSNVRLAILSGILLTVILVIVLIYTKKNQKTQLEKIEKEKEQAILKSFIQGEERERNRISHELHDGVAAMIGTAKMRMEAIPFLDAEQQVQQFIKIN